MNLTNQPEIYPFLDRISQFMDEIQLQQMKGRVSLTFKPKIQ